jgi:hypothetical protein
MAIGDSFRTEPQVLPQTGVPIQASVGFKGEVLTAATRPRFYDLNYNFRLFHGLATATMTGVSVNGVATVGTTSAITLYNPPNSKINATILRAVWNYISGTMGLCGLFWCYQAATAIPTTLGVVANGQCTQGTSKCYIATGGGSFGSNCVAIRPSGITFGAFAGGAGNVQPPNQEVLEGDIMVPPGFSVGLVALGAAGTTDRSNLSLSWAEEPV